jgi:hypothetical protein
MAVYADCDGGCGGQIVVGLFDTIKVPELDAEGNEVPDLNAKPDPRTGAFPARKVTLRLPRHRLMEAVSELRPHGHFNDGQRHPGCSMCYPEAVEA